MEATCSQGQKMVMPLIQSTDHLDQRGCHHLRQMADRGHRLVVGFNLQLHHPRTNFAQKINQRFDQVEVSWKRDFESTGLGLALVKALMLQHDGDVSITSEVGVGTTVTCHFPPRRTLNLPRESGYAA